MRKITGLVVIAIVFCSCNQQEKSVTGDVMGVQALLWSQLSAEAEALYVQAYNISEVILRDSVAENPGRAWAVVLDIDETVLDNSPFDVERKRKGLAYSEEIWGEWCEMREAIALPGALEFITVAEELDVEVFYISNRRDALLGATLDNLRALGFPFADSAHVLLKMETSSKDARRAIVEENHEILLLIGDNLGDFAGVFDDRSNNYGKAEVRKMRDQFGKRFIVLPNPMYGKWERGAFPDGMPEEKEVLNKLRGY